MQAGNFSFKNIKIWKVGEENGEPYAFIYKQGIEENPVVAFQYHDLLHDAVWGVPHQYIMLDY